MEKPLGRRNSGSEKIKVDQREIWCEGVGWIQTASGQGPEMEFCEQDNDISGFMIP
jgi:hypothetical protein